MRPLIQTIAPILFLITACATEPDVEVGDDIVALDVRGSDFSVTREHVRGDVVHYQIDIPVGDTANATLRLHRMVRERRPGRPMPSANSIMLLHGDFATFATNFAPILGDPDTESPGLALWLAERDIDVWGFDRRWSLAPSEDPDLSDFDAMGLEMQLADIHKALRVARSIRLFTDRSIDRMVLSGFSRGGAMSYYYASQEAQRPAWKRHIKGLIPLDVYASVDPANADLRDYFCGLAQDEYAALDAGFASVSNGFQIDTGQFALDAPDDPNPFGFPFAGATNQDLLLELVGRTYVFFRPSPVYHLIGSVLDDNGEFATALRDSPDSVVGQWLADAPPYQSMRESADTDAILCDPEASTFDVPLSRIEVPVFLLAAAGGYGELSLHSTTEVSSTDVSSLVIRKLAAEDEAEDYGHADLLYASDAPTIAWPALHDWLLTH